MILSYVGQFKGVFQNEKLHTFVESWRSFEWIKIFNFLWRQFMAFVWNGSCRRCHGTGMAFSGNWIFSRLLWLLEKPRDSWRLLLILSGSCSACRMRCDVERTECCGNETSQLSASSKWEATYKNKLKVEEKAAPGYLSPNTTALVFLLVPQLSDFFRARYDTHTLHILLRVSILGYS